MKHEGVVLVLESREMFDFMAPIIERELATHQVVHRDNREAAFTFLQEHGGAPVEVVFADWDRAGPEFIQMVRRAPETHHTPIIVLSDSDADAVVAAAMHAGANDHLFKPFLEKGLVHKLQFILANRERRRMHRAHPAAGMQVGLRLPGESAQPLELLDISIGGCRLRAPLALSRGLAIYDRATLEIPTDRGAMAVGGHLVRMAEDADDAPHSVRITYVFDDLGEVRGPLGDLLETLNERWHREHPG